MSLVLSRLQLNPFSMRAMALAADPTKLHNALYALFDKSDSGRILFRVDPENAGPLILIQSSVEPDWSKLELFDKDLRGEPMSKPLQIAVGCGDELTFRLMARATRVASMGAPVEKKARKDLRTDEERLEWLRRKGELGGFQVRTCGLAIFTLAAVKSNVSFRAKGGSFSAVRFDGELVVTDPAKLEQTVATGVGTQKAYGFGLLSLGRQ